MGYRTLLREYRTLLVEYWAFLREYRALLVKYRAFLRARSASDKVKEKGGKTGVEERGRARARMKEEGDEGGEGRESVRERESVGEEMREGEGERGVERGRGERGEGNYTCPLYSLSRPSTKSFL